MRLASGACGGGEKKDIYLVHEDELLRFMTYLARVIQAAPLRYQDGLQAMRTLRCMIWAALNGFGSQTPIGACQIEWHTSSTTRVARDMHRFGAAGYVAFLGLPNRVAYFETGSDDDLYPLML